MDENLPPKLKSAVLKIQQEIDILRVGDSNTPPLGTLDPEILIYLELSKQLLVTDNRKSIPGHLEEHWAAGGQSWGLVWVRPSEVLADGQKQFILFGKLLKTKNGLIS